MGGPATHLQDASQDASPTSSDGDCRKARQKLGTSLQATEGFEALDAPPNSVLPVKPRHAASGLACPNQEGHLLYHWHATADRQHGKSTGSFLPTISASLCSAFLCNFRCRMVCGARARRHHHVKPCLRSLDQLRYAPEEPCDAAEKPAGRPSQKLFNSFTVRIVASGVSKRVCAWILLGLNRDVSDMIAMATAEPGSAKWGGRT